MPRGQALIEEIDQWTGPPGRLAFWWLGQASVILKLAGKVVYIDPYLTPDPRRQTPPLLAPEEVTNADLVLGTHDHADHIDPHAIPGMAKASPGARFVVPIPSVARVEALGVAPDRLIGLNAGDTHVEGPLTVTALKSRHEFFDPTPEGHFPYLGYVLRADSVSAYHSGDTINYDGLLSTLAPFSPDVVFLPINGRDAERFRRGCIGNLTYQEAVDLAGDLAPRLAVPTHYDMFATNSEDPQEFVDYLAAKYPHVPAWVGAPGERVEVEGRDAS